MQKMKSGQVLIIRCLFFAYFFKRLSAIDNKKQTPAN